MRPWLNDIRLYRVGLPLDFHFPRSMVSNKVKYGKHVVGDRTLQKVLRPPTNLWRCLLPRHATRWAVFPLCRRKKIPADAPAVLKQGVGQKIGRQKPRISRSNPARTSICLVCLLVPHTSTAYPLSLFIKPRWLKWSLLFSKNGERDWCTMWRTCWIHSKPRVSKKTIPYILTNSLENIFGFTKGAMKFAITL